ncbi:MAG: hypothetical protein FJ294_02165 [Planctomycetes bacterium]|nr:hypothetical protein [Planctomycetota bacterium]
MRLRALCVLACLPLCASFPAAQTFAFRADKGASVEKRFAMDLSMDLDEFSMSVGDEELPDEHIGSLEMSIQQESRLVFEDTYPQGAEGRPALLHRKFVALANEERQTMGGLVDDESESSGETTSETSELEGRTVAFRWNAEEDKFDLSYEGESEGADEALLEGLIEDCDLRGVLPAVEVGEGDTWDLDAQVFDLLTGPGGDVALEDPTDEDDSDDDLDEQFRENIEGDLKATFAGLREVEGAKLAVIELRGSAKTHAEQDASEGEGHGGTRSLALEFSQIEGEVLWDLELGRAVSYSLSGNVQARIVEDSTLEFDGQSIEMSQRMTLVGKLSATGTFAAAE